MALTPVLSEQWLPIETIGAECMRDASAARKPPLNRIHVHPQPGRGSGGCPAGAPGVPLGHRGPDRLRPDGRRRLDPLEALRYGFRTSANELKLVRHKRIIAKQGSNVILQTPGARRKKGMVDPAATEFGCWLDAAHTAMLAYQEDGSKACEAFLKRTGLITAATFKLVLQSMINAIPRARGRGRAPKRTRCGTF